MEKALLFRMFMLAAITSFSFWALVGSFSACLFMFSLLSFVIAVADYVRSK